MSEMNPSIAKELINNIDEILHEDKAELQARIARHRPPASLIPQNLETHLRNLEATKSVNEMLRLTKAYFVTLNDELEAHLEIYCFTIKDLLSDYKTHTDESERQYKESKISFEASVNTKIKTITELNTVIKEYEAKLVDHSVGTDIHANVEMQNKSLSEDLKVARKIIEDLKNDNQRLKENEGRLSADLEGVKATLGQVISDYSSFTRNVAEKIKDSSEWQEKLAFLGGSLSELRVNYEVVQNGNLKLIGDLEKERQGNKEKDELIKRKDIEFKKIVQTKDEETKKLLKKKEDELRQMMEQKEKEIERINGILSNRDYLIKNEQEVNKSLTLRLEQAEKIITNVPSGPKDELLNQHHLFTNKFQIDLVALTTRITDYFVTNDHLRDERNRAVGEIGNALQYSSDIRAFLDLLINKLKLTISTDTIGVQLYPEANKLHNTLNPPTPSKQSPAAEKRKLPKFDGDREHPAKKPKKIGDEPRKDH